MNDNVLYKIKGGDTKSMIELSIEYQYININNSVKIGCIVTQ